MDRPGAGLNAGSPESAGRAGSGGRVGDSRVGPAFTEVRQAVRTWLREYAPDGEVCVGLSGGGDSLALTAAAAREARSVQAVGVDHRLQEGSADVARRAAEQARALGCSARVVPVDVNVDGPGGMEAAARRARYAALDEVRTGRPVLLAHTLDDQAETVLLGLGRGSGPHSIRGMAAWDEPWGRPLLGVRRTVTRAACAELGLDVWDDPQNTDPRFTRVRLRREVLPLLEDVLGGGAAEALGRTAAQLRDDDAELEALAADLGAAASMPDAETAVGHPARALDAGVLASGSSAVRRRVLRSWLQEQGVTGLTDARLRQADALVGRWRGQGGVAVGGGGPDVRIVVVRQHGRLTVVREQRAPAGGTAEQRGRRAARPETGPG